MVSHIQIQAAAPVGLRSSGAAATPAARAVHALREALATPVLSVSRAQRGLGANGTTARTYPVSTWHLLLALLGLVALAHFPMGSPPPPAEGLRHRSAAAVSATPTSTGTCGATPTPPDCDKHDYGSCGNACCLVELSVAPPAIDAYNTIAAYLESGGSDGLFARRSGPQPPSMQDPTDDLTPYEGAKPWMYILQGTHQTSGLHYEDTINVAIKQDAGAETVVARLFSTSEIHGALGDDGQNFKNVMTVLQDVFGATASQVHVKHGCAQAMS